MTKLKQLAQAIKLVIRAKRQAETDLVTHTSLYNYYREAYNKLSRRQKRTVDKWAKQLP